MYQSYIGLEIHIQLQTKTKIFCGCRAAFGDEPNTNVCPVCMGYPGVLPALNEEAMRMAYLVARALNCTLAPTSYFARKNYFYPDLPKNYQISQFGSPVGVDGYVDLEFHRNRKRVRIHECHLEEDAGKMIHAGDMSLLDYNRAGTPLLEIVTEPDLEIGDEAELLLQQFRRMVRYLGVCDGNMEEGSLRCDANVSVNEVGKGLGRKVEIKNLNSSRFVRLALNHEISRQNEVLDNGGTIVQETRLWNENRDITEPMRTKESAHDYRYFPEPDLPPFRTDEAFLARIESGLVELPNERKARLRRQYSLPELAADFICEEKPVADYFEEAVRLGADAQAAATWLSGDVKKELNRRGLALSASPLTEKRFASLLTMLNAGRIHGKIAKQTLEVVFSEDKDPEAIIRERGWEQISDPAALAQVVDRVLQENPESVETIARGDWKPLGFLMGKIMAATGGRAEPRAAQALVKQRLSVQVIQVLSFGGAISGSRRSDGLVVPGDLMDVQKLFKDDPTLPSSVRFNEVQLGRFLSEEITPSDWASLIHSVAECLEKGEASGIVVAHGTDTLAYTASLLYWMFSDTRVPIVLTAAATPAVVREADSGTVSEADGAAPGRGGSGPKHAGSSAKHAGSGPNRMASHARPEGEAIGNLKRSVEKALEGSPGVYVVYGDEVYSPINLRFQRFIGNGSSGTFRNWNQDAPRYNGPALRAEGIVGDAAELQTRLESAIRTVFIAKVYPGMRAESIIALINAGIRYFILEIYDTGTANLRETPYSLRHAFEYAKGRGVRFFCTSQQEGTVDFSEYVTGHQLWSAGAIPMGTLTTESVYTRLLVALLVSENDEELVRHMEEI